MLPKVCVLENIEYVYCQSYVPRVLRWTHGEWNLGPHKYFLPQSDGNRPLL